MYGRCTFSVTHPNSHFERSEWCGLSHEWRIFLNNHPLLLLFAAYIAMNWYFPVITDILYKLVVNRKLQNNSLLIAILWCNSVIAFFSFFPPLIDAFPFSRFFMFLECLRKWYCLSTAHYYGRRYSGRSEHYLITRERALICCAMNYLLEDEKRNVYEKELFICLDAWGSIHCISPSYLFGLITSW